MCSKNVPNDTATAEKDKNRTISSAPITAEVHSQADRNALPTLPLLDQSVPAVTASAAPVQDDTRFDHLKQIHVERHANVTAPARTLLDLESVSEYGHRYNEQKVSANKRAKKTRYNVSPLYTKEKNAKLFEAAKAVETDRQIRLLSAASAGMTIKLKEEDTVALTKLMNGNLSHDQALLRDYAGDKASKEKAIIQILDDFLSRDLSVYNLSDDTAIAGKTAAFEELNSCLEGLDLLQKKHPAFFKNLPSKVKDSLKQQTTNALHVVSYYRVTKMIATDAYYRSHMNSEISRQLDPHDPPEKQRLTRLLWRQTALATYSNNGTSWKTMPDGAVLGDSVEVKQHSKEYTDVYADISDSSGEYGKAMPYTDQTNPHLAFFNSFSATHPALDDAIKNTKPRLAGTDIVMKETAARTTLRAMASLRGTRDMTEPQILKMLEDMYSQPQDSDQPDQIEAVKQKNIDGFRTYKKLVTEHAFYLDRKYSHLYENCPIDEISSHKTQIQDDLCSLQIMCSFLDFIKQIPELYDPENPEDRQLERVLETINLMGMTQRGGFAEIVFGEGSSKIFNRDRIGMIITETMFCIGNADLNSLHFLEKLENDKPGVNWDAEVIHSKQTSVQKEQALSDTVEQLKDKKKKEESVIDSDRAKSVLAHQDFSYSNNPEKTSDLMKDVKACYTELDKRMKETLPSNEADFASALDQIMRQYDDLLRSTRTYEKKRHPVTTLGRQRKKMVQAIHRNAAKERAFFETRAKEYFISGKGGTFGDILKDMRTVVLQPTRSMKNVGAATSVVYRLQHEGKTVFFKPEEELYDRLDIAETMLRHRPAHMSTEDEKMFDAIIAALKKRKAVEKDELEKLPAGQDPSTLDHHLNRATVGMFMGSAAAAYIRAGKKINPSDIDSYDSSLMAFPEIMYAYRSSKDKTETDHMRRILKLLEPSLITFNLGNFMNTNAQMDPSESAVIRNVATSRVADILGISGIVAKSEYATLNKDGRLIAGIVMDGAEGAEIGKVFDKAKEDGAQVKYTADALLQISMMYVLDGLCGQVDRKLDNFFAQYTVDSGVYTITGITAIDNDMAFGTYDKTYIPKETLIALPPEFVQTIRDLDPAVLTHALSDILAPDKLTALAQRLADLKQLLTEKEQESPDLTDITDSDSVITRFMSRINAPQPNNTMPDKYYPKTVSN